MCLKFCSNFDPFFGFHLGYHVCFHSGPHLNSSLIYYLCFLLLFWQFIWLTFWLPIRVLFRAFILAPIIVTIKAQVCFIVWPKLLLRFCLLFGKSFALFLAPIFFLIIISFTCNKSISQVAQALDFLGQGKFFMFLNVIF